MYTLITVVIVFICACIVLVVLVQNSKGGGFVSGMGGSTQIMGARKSADFLEQLTWGLAIGLLAICLLANFALPTKGDKVGNSSELKDKLENYAAPASAPTSAPSNAPAPTSAPAPAADPAAPAQK